jgi:hypothetical protein
MSIMPAPIAGPRNLPKIRVIKFPCFAALFTLLIA